MTGEGIGPGPGLTEPRSEGAQFVRLDASTAWLPNPADQGDLARLLRHGVNYLLSQDAGVDPRAERWISDLGQASTATKLGIPIPGASHIGSDSQGASHPDPMLAVMTISEMAERFGVTPRRARQIAASIDPASKRRSGGVLLVATSAVEALEAER